MARKKRSEPIILVGHVQGDPADLPPGILYHPGRGPNKPRRVSPEPQVSDDPEQIAWLRQAHAARLRQLRRAALRNLKTGPSYFDLVSRKAFRAGDVNAIRSLNKVLADETAVPRARFLAASLLAGMGRTEGRQFLRAALESSDPERLLAAMECFDNYGSGVPPEDPELAPLLLTCLMSDHGPVVEKAAHKVEFSKIPGAEEAFVAALRAAPSHPRKLAEALIRHATTAESVSLAVPHLFGECKERFSSFGWRLDHVLKHADPAFSAPLRTAFREWLLGYTGEIRLSQHWADDFSRVAAPQDEPILEDIVARSTDPVARVYALRALVRFHPEQAIDRTLAECQRFRLWNMLLDLVVEHATEADFERIRPVLRLDEISEKAARLLEERFGPRGQALLDQHMNSLDPHARQWLHWKRERLSVRAALEELHAAGVLPQVPEPMDYRDSDEDDPPEENHPGTILRALGPAGLAICFDTETGFVPCRHDELIEDFTSSSGGRFAVECPLQLWHRQGEQDFDAPYTVLFLHGGRLYRFGAENYGDYYDVEAVVRALNYALELNGQRERFIGLHTGDQCAEFVFADPSAFVPIAQKYQVPLTEDPSAGMRAGRAFEQQVMGGNQP